MNKLLFGILVLLALIAFSSTVLINDAMAEDGDKIPAWVQGVFGFYADGNIGDDELIQGLQFLISNEVIEIPSQETASTDGNKLAAENQNLRTELNLLKTEKSNFLGKHSSYEEYVDSVFKTNEHNLKVAREAQSDRNEATYRIQELENKYSELSDLAQDWHDENVELKEKIAELEKQIEELQSQ